MMKAHILSIGPLPQANKSFKSKSGRKCTHYCPYDWLIAFCNSYAYLESVSHVENTPVYFVKGLKTIQKLLKCLEYSWILAFNLTICFDF